MMTKHLGDSVVLDLIQHPIRNNNTGIELRHIWKLIKNERIEMDQPKMIEMCYGSGLQVIKKFMLNDN